MEQANESLPQSHASGPKRARKLLACLSLGLVLAMVLVACSTPALKTTTHTTGSRTPSATSTPTNSSGTSGSSTPAASTSTTSTGTSTGTAPSSAVAEAIKGVIQKANQEQQQAFANQSPSAMQDTATSSYYDQMVQDNQQLSSLGITAIKLDSLRWGDITLEGSTTARATTTETWTSTYQDGSSTQDTATNVYTLVLQNGSWKIQNDDQTSSGTQSASGQPPSGGSGSGSSGSTSPVTGVVPLSLDQSSNWSGYYATGGTYSAVAATWKVPTVSASGSTGADATWVGIGGVSSTDLIQAGTDATVRGGQVSYEAWIEMLPRSSQTVPLTVDAGDTISASITQQTDGTWKIVIKDLTTSQTYQTTVSYNSSLSSAEWIEEAPATGRSAVLPLDNFGSVNFTNATTVVDGKTESIQQAGGQPITMNNSFGQVLAQPSTLGADGKSFNVTRTSAPSSVNGVGGFHRFP